jgi:fumarate hydratase class II
MIPATSRAAVRSMATLTHATRAANPAARNLLSVAARSPAVTRALSSSRQISQFPRIQTLSNSKRAFSTSVTMVREAAVCAWNLC